MPTTWLRRCWRRLLSTARQLAPSPLDADPQALRQALRELSRADQIGIRTARMGTAVVVRVDAALWNQDAATMRRKLTPPV